MIYLIEVASVKANFYRGSLFLWKYVIDCAL